MNIKVGQADVGYRPCIPPIRAFEYTPSDCTRIQRAGGDRIYGQGLNIEVITQPVVDVIPCIPPIRAFEYATTECTRIQHIPIYRIYCQGLNKKTGQAGVHSRPCITPIRAFEYATTACTSIKRICIYRIYSQGLNVSTLRAGKNLNDFGGGIAVNQDTEYNKTQHHNNMTTKRPFHFFNPPFFGLHLMPMCKVLFIWIQGFRYLGITNYVSKLWLNQFG